MGGHPRGGWYRGEWGGGCSGRVRLAEVFWVSMCGAWLQPCAVGVCREIESAGMLCEQHEQCRMHRLQCTPTKVPPWVDTAAHPLGRCSGETSPPWSVQASAGKRLSQLIVDRLMASDDEVTGSPRVCTLSPADSS